MPAQRNKTKAPPPHPSAGPAPMRGTLAQSPRELFHVYSAPTAGGPGRGGRLTLRLTSTTWPGHRWLLHRTRAAPTFPFGGASNCWRETQPGPPWSESSVGPGWQEGPEEADAWVKQTLPLQEEEDARRHDGFASAAPMRWCEDRISPTAITHPYRRSGWGGWKSYRGNQHVAKTPKSS